ncbi:ABC transporter substrate-binding protein [Paenibacillus sp. YPG26]|uniref:ABC transporter substrate-binding protein n=1 Tax=Paenibacillus sp. YPG26 TaxID=2878915 RepID=UPI00203F09CF|nr:ABC transporter substrate-binding protein [Paenibacillus sp. YPG26]USB34383.1 ABC transporter substrate-binding protein [Paenibacillus sp. YPG26]
MKMRRISILFVVLIFISGCRSEQSREVATQEATILPALHEQEFTELPQDQERPLVLGFSQVGSESAWRAANTKSIKEAAKQASVELLFEDAQQKQENQIQAIRSFITRRVDVIGFSPVVESGWEEVLKEAKDAGIPVIITDRSVNVADPSLYITLIGSNFTEEGRKAGKYVLDKMRLVRGPIQIAEIQGTLNSAPAIDRKKGFEEMISRNPAMSIVASDTGDFTRESGKAIMTGYLKKYGKDIQVLYSHNDDMAFGAIEAIEEAGLRPGNDIVIVSVDGGKEAFQAMLAGKLNCTVECNPLLGPQLIQAAKEVVAGHTLPKRIVTREGVFTKGTAARAIENRKY